MVPRRPSGIDAEEGAAGARGAGDAAAIFAAASTPPHTSANLALVYGWADETADGARWADGLAESTAETRRDESAAYERGKAAGEADNAAAEARRELLPLLAELRALRRSRVAGETPAACKALRSAVDSLLETISKKRAKRDRAWGDSGWQGTLDSWRAGFMDESEGGFVRAVRLGYASRDDWRGAPEANPCGVMA